MAHTVAALEAELPGREMNDLVTEILASSLGSLGLFSNGARALADLSLEKRPASYYDRWLASSIDYLRREHLLDDDATFARPVRPLAELWEEWKERSGAWAGNPNQQAQSALLETCLRALPGIIGGRLLATDVMFPSSSMHLVEGVYRGNPQANYFNDVLCETLTGFIEEQLAVEGERKIRIVEIGAGTGGTTATLLPVLTRYPVEEYCYTDVSKAFLMYAEKQFRPEFPALGTALFDVSKPLAPQSIRESHYDFAVAANVLHATSDIRETLRNAKATLRHRGVLLLNEISAWSLFNHLTFGLLEGWWLYEDAPLRLPGSPGLAPERWREILEEEGFEAISFPAEEAHRLGQQIVVAVSDGRTRQRIAAPVTRAAGTAPGPAKPASVAVPPAIAATASDTAADTSERAAFDYARQIVVSKLSEALRMDVAMIRDETSFADYGVDSIVGVNLVRTICEALQIELETTSLFEYSTVHQLTEHIVTRWSEQIAAQALSARPTAVPPSVPPAVKVPPPVGTPSTVGILRNTRFAAAGVEESAGPHFRSESGPIAIIGMSGRFAESESLDAFWDNLVQGRDLVKPVSRWNPDDCVISGKVDGGHCRSGSFVDSIDRFDAAFFGIPSLEAAYMDPQQRLFLEEAWKALEDAGYAGRSVHEKPCGVYVGCGSSSYDRLSAGQTPPQAFWGNSQAVTPARIAYCLNLQGPAMAIDTACSSSLVAIHLACQGLWSGETEMALAGGVFLQPTPGFYRVANRAGMLSPDGKCYSFDARANGFVPGEGVGVVVLKRLRDALSDGDYVHGVIAGSGINQDGRSNGLIAPNGRAQERLERWVYDRFGIDPATIQVVEAHGTGTIMGDSIEYAALSRAFRAYTDNKRFCALGTVKTNIGHTSTAAGVAGVLKLLLALKHRQIPPSIHFEKANPAIDVDSGPFYVNTEAREWTAGQDGKRRAAVSSFGFSGTNAHLILEEAPSVERPAVQLPAYLVAISARTRDQLRQQAESLAAHLRRWSDLSMGDLSFSLVVGRAHLDHRLACIARDQAELLGRLEQWLGAGAAADVYTAEAHDGRARDRESLRKFGDYCIRECRGAATAEVYVENLTAVADLWVQGCSLDLSPLFGPDSRRVPLPTYPFARDRHWVEDTAVVPARPAVVAEARIPAGSDRPRGERPPASGAGHDVRGWVQDELSREAAEILPLHSDELATDRALLDLGFDSMSLTTLAEAINRRFGTNVTPILFFDHPTIAEITSYLTAEHEDEILRFAAESRGGDAAPRRADRQTTEAATRSDAAPAVAIGSKASERTVSSSPRTFSPEPRFVTEPIAIVGMAGVMPQSRDVHELWLHLRSASDLITVIPEDRWNWEDHYGDPLKEPNKSSSKWGGFMTEVDKFDPLFFGISPREAQMMDPQQRIFLETVWKAIEDSGQKVSDLAGTRTGVFVGVGSNDYIDVLRSEADVLDGYTASGNSHSVLANRVSFLLNLRGPSAPVDTACSSSLVALHRAVESIHTRSCDMAIVGGVQVILSPGAYVSFSVAGMLSGDGKCKTFDKRADGYVRGEGCGVILLKPLSVAQADRNHIYAVIKSTAENHGGRVTTMTAPNSSAQAALLVEAYEKAGIDPATVGYIECHGTGTALGDPIEVQALTKAFSELYRQHGNAPAATPTCGLGTIKTNIGHLETAAGIAGVLKVLLAMKHAELPPNLHFEELNPYIRLEGTPFYVVDSLKPWERPAGGDGAPIPRRAGVSSFGFGGANAHVVLEEYVPPARPARPPAAESPQLIVVSAKSEERLAAYLSSIRSYLDRVDVELVDLAYTLQVGRDEMPQRTAIVASSTEELRRKLDTVLAGGPLPPDCYRDNAARRQAKGAAGADTDASVESLVAGRELSKLAERWVSGARIDWESLHEPGVPRRISAPAYPFARERYWVASGAERSAAGQQHRMAGATAYLHPLVHRNVSTLDEQKFASRLSGDEVRASEYAVGARKTFPAGACLEMAVAAAERSRSAKARVLRNIVWQTPLVMNGEARDVEVSLVPGRSGVAFAVRSLGASMPVTHCSGGVFYDAAMAAPDALDVARIRARCAGHVMSGTDVYEVLAGAGLSLGRSFRIIEAIHVGESESLAVLQIPEQVHREWDRFSLHPAVIDGSLHAVLGLMKSSGMELEAMIPASAAEVELFDSPRDVRYAYATRAVHGVKNAFNGSGGVESTVQLLDGNGRVLVRMKNVVCSPVRNHTSEVAVRAADERPRVAAGAVKSGLHSLLPVWNPLQLQPASPVPADPGKVVLLRDDPEHLEWIRSYLPDAEMVGCPPGAGIDDIAARLAEHSLDHLLWIAPDVEHGTERETPATESLVDRQEEGVLAVFRVIKAVLLLGYGNRNLRWTFVTGRTQHVVVAQTVHPAHAGVTGLVGSLAKEYPQWDVRLLDVESLASVTAAECLSLPWDRQGNALAHRRGEWFRQALALLSRPQDPPLFRRNGTYVVIGGAGGIGEVWTRYMIENYQANVVWLGRRPLDGAIQEKIDSLAALGTAPLYLTADAASRDALAQARASILETFPAIHGVVHSAIVLNDHTLARMDEPGFRASFSAKVDTSVNMDLVFGADEPDFMLFFSSIISFGKSAGQSNYSAGCTFKDAFAQRLQQQRRYPVKIMNWGYWGEVGIVKDEAYNRSMRQMGIGSIQPDEGMAALQVLVGSEVAQLALIKTLNEQATEVLDLAETVTHVADAAPPVLSQVAEGMAARRFHERIDALEATSPAPGMTELATEILASTLASLGVFETRPVGDRSTAGVAPAYERWVQTTNRHLQRQGLVDDDLALRSEVRALADIWTEWEHRRPLWGAGAGLQAQIALTEACLRALPAVLAGKQRATDVIFPSSSMHLVEGVYRDNAHADYYNDVLSAVLVECIEQQLRADGERRLRILEIGAGTGGTTAKLLPLLERYRVDEYCYTDLSKAFLMHAGRNFQPRFAPLQTAIFDVSRPLAPQSIQAGHYDFVIAANVLHATPNIRETVRNAKAALKRNGVLLLNEISEWSLFSHVTFGLLEGWWLYEDPAVRLPGNPGLAPETWRHLLTDEGFASILFPAEAAHRFGQQIIAASSNGWSRQRIVSDVAPRAAAAAKPDSRAAAASPAVLEASAAMRRDHVRRVITEKLSEALMIDPTLVRGDVPMTEYGVDSIIGVNLVRTISETLQVELETSSLFECNTVDLLADAILTNYQPVIAVQAVPAQDVVAGADHGAAAMASTRADEVHTPIVRRLGNGDRGRLASTTVEPIAVIGMSGRFAESESLDALWKHLVEGRSLVQAVSRWPASACAPAGSAGDAFCSQGSFIDRIDEFDAAFFGIAPDEAVSMDPQERLFLQEAWRALEHAGYAGPTRAMRGGVYVGCGSSGYEMLAAASRGAERKAATVVPARVARHLNLHGPAIAVDTGGSSSLVAIHLACQALWSDDCEVAIAGGVALHATPEIYQAARGATARADGDIPGEGVGVVFLKRLRDALEDGDHVVGVIAASGIDRDGSAYGVAPTAEWMERLIDSVYARSCVDPATIRLMETSGDPVECAAIGRALRKYTQKTHFSATGTVKTNVGDTGAAAGIAGLLKVLLSLQHRCIPPSLHLERVSPEIDFDSGPMYVNTAIEEWMAESTEVRRAGVTSFGRGGMTVFMVVEEAPPVQRQAVQSPGSLVALSARSAEQLTRQVRNLLAALERAPELSMNDLSFTLLTGRRHLPHRLACVAQDRSDLMARLGQWLETGTATRIYTAVTREREKQGEAWKALANRCVHDAVHAPNAAAYLDNLEAIAELYVQGHALDFDAMFPAGTGRIPLPPYPFTGERYWVDGAAADVRARRLHPLLHVNTSTLAEQSYRSVFTGQEPFLEELHATSNGHGGHNVLPEGACLEMMRAAIEAAAGIGAGAAVVELQDASWDEPVIVDGARAVTVALLQTDGDALECEVYSGQGDDHRVHCQGRAFVLDRAVPAAVDVDALRAQASLLSRDDPDARQLVAPLSVPPEADGLSISAILLNGAVQAGLRLVSDSRGIRAGRLLPERLKRLRVVAPCCREMLVWARPADAPDERTAVDIDLLDMRGNVCLEMRGLTFHVDEASVEPVEPRTWLFSTERRAALDGQTHGQLGPTETIELFLRQEAALALGKPQNEIAADRTYFDLGFSSAASARFIDALNSLLGEELSTGVLFDHRDIRSLAADLSSKFPEKIAALTVVPLKIEHPSSARRRRALSPLLRSRRYASGAESAWPEPESDAVSDLPPSDLPPLGEQVLARVLWNDAPVDDMYEKLTF